MLRSEHLDVRTVTMGISLFDCAAPDFDTFAYKVRSKILRNAEKLVETCDIVGDRYGIPVVNKRISVSPMATVCAGFTRDQMVEACRVLDDCAKDVGVDFIGGFGALVEKGMTPGERNLIDALPEALATTDRICSSINVGSTKAGINMDAVKLMGERILDVAAATADRDAIGCAKLVVFCNIPQDVPFMAGAYLGVGEPDVVINVGVSGPGVVKKALDRAFEGVPGQQEGDDFPGALLDDRAVVEQRELHAFGVAVDGLAVGAVEGVECLGISLEIHGFVSDLMFGEKAFDDFAPQAVGCGIQGDAFRR